MKAPALSPKDFKTSSKHWLNDNVITNNSLLGIVLSCQKRNIGSKLMLMPQHPSLVRISRCQPLLVRALIYEGA